MQKLLYGLLSDRLKRAKCSLAKALYLRTDAFPEVKLQPRFAHAFDLTDTHFALNSICELQVDTL